MYWLVSRVRTEWKKKTEKNRRMTFKLVVQVGSKGKVVDEDYIGRIYFLRMGRVEEVPFNEFVLSIALPPPSHPFLE